MRGVKSVSALTGLLALTVLLGGCVVAPAHEGYHERGAYGEPQEGYYDRDHHRYWHDHRWHRCDEDDPHCR